MVEHDSDDSDDSETEEAVEGASSVSRVLSCDEGFSWPDRASRVYKEDAQSNWRGVTRTSLVGGSDEIPVPFQLRYFEVEAGGYSSREKHAHQHVVVVVRGRGSVTLGDKELPVSFGDVVYVAPWDVHQFRNPDGPEPLGFLCVVAAERDRPVPVE